MTTDFDITQEKHLAVSGIADPPIDLDVTQLARVLTLHDSQDARPDRAPLHVAYQVRIDGKPVEVAEGEVLISAGSGGATIAVLPVRAKDVRLRRLTPDGYGTWSVAVAGHELCSPLQDGQTPRGMAVQLAKAIHKAGPEGTVGVAAMFAEVHVGGPA